MRTNLTILLAIVLMLIPVQAFAQDAGTIPPPDDYDIYDPESGEFLDTYYGLYLAGASQAYAAGDYELAAQYYLTYLASDNGDFTALYNLACCYGLLGEAELAEHYLIKALTYGFDDVDLLEIDPDFDSLRESGEWDDILAEVDAFIENNWIDTERIFIPGMAYTPCHVRLPEDFDESDSHTLVVGLHGGFSASYFFSGLYDSFEDPEFVFACIQGQYAGIYGHGLLYNWDTWKHTLDELPAEATQYAVDYIASNVEYLADLYNADKVILLGFSNGGRMAFNTAFTNPDLFDGLISLTGWLDTTWLDEDEIMDSVDMPVLVIYGPNDAFAGHPTGQEAYEILDEYDFDATYFEHDVQQYFPPEVLEAIQEWVAAQ